jgi:iron complex transport system substrate-binding protein
MIDRYVPRDITRMRAFSLILRVCTALVLLTLAEPVLARTVTDATWRKVEIPDRIERVLPAGAPAAVLLYTLAPAKMIGWTHTPGDLAKPFLYSAILARPELPALMRDGRVQSDEIRALKPDLILDYGSTGMRYADRARKLQDETGIPVLLLDGKLELTPETYRRLGAVLSVEAHAEELAEAAQHLLDLPLTLQSSAAPLRVYYARSADGLVTATSASTLADVIRIVGAANVADATGKSDGLVRVSREQIAGWNPDAVVTNSPEFWKERQSPEWSALPAVA